MACVVLTFQIRRFLQDLSKDHQSINLHWRRRQVGTRICYQRYNYMANIEDKSKKVHIRTFTWATYIEVPSNATLNRWVKCAVAWSNNSSNCSDEGQKCIFPNCTSKILVKITAQLFCMIPMCDGRIACPWTWFGFEFNRAKQLHNVNLWLKTWSLYDCAIILDSSIILLSWPGVRRRWNNPTGSNKNLSHTVRRWS